MVLKGIQFSEKELCPSCVLAVHVPRTIHVGPDAGGLERIHQFGLGWNIYYIDIRDRRGQEPARIKNSIQR